MRKVGSSAKKAPLPKSSAHNNELFNWKPPTELPSAKKEMKTTDDLEPLESLISDKKLDK